MDYIQEEFLRQHAALETLMGGGNSTSARPESALSEEISPTAAPTITADDTAWRYGGTLEAAEISPARGRREHPIPAEVRRTELRGGNLPSRAASAGNTPFAEEIYAEEPVAFYAHPHAEEAAIAARDVSRAIQRDARRYDGGFSIY